MDLVHDDSPRNRDAGEEGLEEQVVAMEDGESFLRENLECPVCHDLLCEPCVPTCGHPFCKACLNDLLDHAVASNAGGAKCPICRRVLHVTRSENLVVCRAFEQLLKHVFSNEYESRKKAHAERRSQPTDTMETQEKLPIFILDATLPKQHLHLNVFEPRYVLMVKRALESGSRKFGMSCSASSERGVEVEIISVAEQWDGRYHLEVVGRRPFRMSSSSYAPAGFLEGDVTYFEMDDGGDEDDGSGDASLQLLQAAEELLPLVDSWEKAVTDGGWQRRPGHLAFVKEHLGPMPALRQPGALAAWIVALVNPLPPLGVAPEMRPALLAANSPSERVAVARKSLVDSLAYITYHNNSIPTKLIRVIPPQLRVCIPFVLVVVAAVILRKGF